MAPTYKGLVLGISQIKINAKKFRIMKNVQQYWKLLKIHDSLRVYPLPMNYFSPLFLQILKNSFWSYSKVKMFSLGFKKKKKKNWKIVTIITAIQEAKWFIWNTIITHTIQILTVPNIHIKNKSSRAVVTGAINITREAEAKSP